MDLYSAHSPRTARIRLEGPGFCYTMFPVDTGFGGDCVAAGSDIMLRQRFRRCLQADRALVAAGGRSKALRFCTFIHGDGTDVSVTVEVGGRVRALLPAGMVCGVSVPPGCMLLCQRSRCSVCSEFEVPLADGGFSTARVQLFLRVGCCFAGGGAPGGMECDANHILYDGARLGGAVHARRDGNSEYFVIDGEGVPSDAFLYENWASSDPGVGEDVSFTT